VVSKAATHGQAAARPRFPGWLPHGKADFAVNTLSLPVFWHWVNLVVAGILPAVEPDFPARRKTPRAPTGFG